MTNGLLIYDRSGSSSCFYWWQSFNDQRFYLVTDISGFYNGVVTAVMDDFGNLVRAQ